jgi:hypothetical protein
LEVGLSRLNFTTRQLSTERSCRPRLENV